ncbi:MAG: hypothetical protein WAK17_15870 [Candidatus Nitrosopolaris sp.]|jgi:hypothetical protein
MKTLGRSPKLKRRSTGHVSEITAIATEFGNSAFIEKNGITFEQTRAARQEASDSHNREETPNFAKSIERRSLVKG